MTLGCGIEAGGWYDSWLWNRKPESDMTLGRGIEAGGWYDSWLWNRSRRVV